MHGFDFYDDDKLYSQNHRIFYIKNENIPRKRTEGGVSNNTKISILKDKYKMLDRFAGDSKLKK